MASGCGFSKKKKKKGGTPWKECEDCGNHQFFAEGGNPTDYAFESVEFTGPVSCATKFN